MASYTNYSEKCFTSINWHFWESDLKTSFNRHQCFLKNVCIVSVILAFTIGLTIGVLIPLVYLKNSRVSPKLEEPPVPHSLQNSTSDFLKNDYNSSVSFVRKPSEKLYDNLIEDGIFWSKYIEKSLPEGYTQIKHDEWVRFVETGEVVQMELGCGRMQNRLVTFHNGWKGCVRYRQNTDQIQGELFSFYLAQILKLPNLVPSSIGVVNLNSKLWRKVIAGIGTAQWKMNRPIVITKYIPNLNSALIPNPFKLNERHLNQLDIVNISKTTNETLLNKLIELAQWSDLIIFDYLTANLDRIVNNLYNYQWNANIMDAPAHNLAKRPDNNLLIFLDNESGLLHGYRLLKKYEAYHSILLDNLCIFRRQTADIIKTLKTHGNVGELLQVVFETKNSANITSVLPSLPEKSIHILNERISKVYNQISKCESLFGDL